MLVVRRTVFTNRAAAVFVRSVLTIEGNKRPVICALCCVSPCSRVDYI